MGMVGHQQIVTYKPGCRFVESDGVQDSHDWFLGQPFGTILGANGYPQARGLVRVNVNPFGRGLSFGKVLH